MMKQGSVELQGEVQEERFKDMIEKLKKEGKLKSK